MGASALLPSFLSVSLFVCLFACLFVCLFVDFVSVCCLFFARLFLWLARLGIVESHGTEGRESAADCCSVLSCKWMQRNGKHEVMFDWIMPQCLVSDCNLVLVEAAEFGASRVV